MNRTRSSRSRFAATAAAILTTLALVATLTAEVSGSGHPPEAAEPRPDIVVVLMDDFSMELLSTMRHAGGMAARGAHYRNAFAVDSMCCPSRASLLTGQYPHQTGVLTNTPNTPNPVGPIGGWAAFKANGNLPRSVNVRMQRAGYTTGFVGKYLNGYGGARPRLPPGWSEWSAILESAYDGWGFAYTERQGPHAVVRRVRKPPAGQTAVVKDRANVGTLTSRIALDFMREHRAETKPYFLVVSTYGTHSRVGPPAYPDDPLFPPAFADRRGPRSCGVPCASLGRGDLIGYGDPQRDNRPRRGDGSPATQWRPADGNAGLPAREAVMKLRDRARMAQSIDRMLARITRAAGPEAYIILTSDNGYHLGQHGLGAGKGTPFNSDVQVPLLVLGPDVEPGVRDAMASLLDLAPTIEDLAGTRSPKYRAGVSLVPTLLDRTTSVRGATFVEHTWSPSLAGDPDRVPGERSTARIPSYLAVRTPDALLVRFDLDNRWRSTSYAWEFYPYDRIGWERTNRFADPRYAEQVAALQRRLQRFDRECLSGTGHEPLSAQCRLASR